MDQRSGPINVLTWSLKLLTHMKPLPSNTTSPHPLITWQLATWRPDPTKDVPLVQAQLLHWRTAPSVWYRSKAQWTLIEMTNLCWMHIFEKQHEILHHLSSSPASVVLWIFMCRQRPLLPNENKKCTDIHQWHSNQVQSCLSVLCIGSQCQELIGLLGRRASGRSAKSYAINQMLIVLCSLPLLLSGKQILRQNWQLWGQTWHHVTVWCHRSLFKRCNKYIYLICKMVYKELYIIPLIDLVFRGLHAMLGESNLFVYF